MAGNLIAGPKALTGELVIIELVRPGDNDTTHALRGQSFSGVLDNVGEFGVVATLDNLGQKFYPWSSVLSISSSEEPS